jgi:hypothetical protein
MMLRLLNPFRIRAAVREIRRVFGDGTPRLVRLVSVDHPAGLILPTATVTIEVEGKNGRKERFCPELPVPFPYAWAWRVARLLHVPLVSAVEPDSFRFALPLRRG